MQHDKIIQGDCIETMKGLPAKSVHCCITSPPYWGQRNYGVDGQLGLEETPEGHIDKLVKVFREVRRILRDDGVLFLNYGDKYAGGNNKGQGNSEKMVQKFSSRGSGNFYQGNLSQGNLVGLAWRLAFALQADGWILRSDIIWAKAVSFCKTYSGSTMPESLNGWRWEQHKVKVKAKKPKEKREVNFQEVSGHFLVNRGDGSKIESRGENAEWQPCPGCPKCEPNGGLVLRKGSWRPTRAHEYLFMLTKTNNYYCDMDAVREAVSEVSLKRAEYGWSCDRPSTKNASMGGEGIHTEKMGERFVNPSGRNLRDVWAINPQSFPEAHYATFPEKLVEPCIKAATSEKGCCPAMIKKLKIREGLTKEEHEKVMQFLTRKGLV